MSSAHKRVDVVITGLGLVTPLGSSTAAFYAALRSGQSALCPDRSLSKWLPAPDAAQGSAPSLARVGDFGATAAIDAGKRRRMPRLGQFCVVAAKQALFSAAAEKPVLDHYGRERAGVVLGTGLGTLDTLLEFTAQYIEGGPGAGSPALFPYTVMNAASALTAMELELLGPNLTINHRDLSFLESVATGCELLACGRLDAVLAGGCDELGAGLLHAYARLGALPDGGEMLPYDRHRRGFWPGEGAVLLVLERAEAAAARGARVLARIAGFGRGADDRPRVGWWRPPAEIELDPEPAVDGAAAAVTASLRMAGCSATDIDFISGCGNGTVLDRVETLALKKALGPAAEQVAIASILGQTGEWLTSAGVRLAAGLYALSEQALPGTLCQAPDPAATLPGLCRSPRPAEEPIRHVLCSSFAQGGGNVSVLLAAE